MHSVINLRNVSLVSECQRCSCKSVSDRWVIYRLQPGLSDSEWNCVYGSCGQKCPVTSKHGIRTFTNHVFIQFCLMLPPPSSSSCTSTSKTIPSVFPSPDLFSRIPLSPSSSAVLVLPCPFQCLFNDAANPVASTSVLGFWIWNRYASISIEQSSIEQSLRYRQQCNCREKRLLLKSRYLMYTMFNHCSLKILTAPQTNTK